MVEAREDEPEVPGNWVGTFDASPVRVGALVGPFVGAFEGSFGAWLDILNGFAV